MENQLRAIAMSEYLDKLFGGTDVGGMGQYALLIIALFIFIIFFYIASFIVRGKKRKASDSLSNIPYIDVTSLQKRGLLTEDETRRVRMALTKQLDHQQKTSAGPRIGGETGLLSDPEVQRLQALADARAAMKAQRGGTTPPEAPRPQMPAVDRESTPRREPDLPVIEVPIHSTPAAADFEAMLKELTQPDEVALPAEVMKMADLGLITPEELERIKQRTRDKKKNLGM